MTIPVINFLTVGNNSAASFAVWMSARRGELGITLDELERRTGIKKQHLSTLERASPHSLTGQPVVPKRPTVEKIATGLEASLDDALFAAGYASDARSFNIGEKARIALLDQNLTPEEQREIAEEMALAYEVIMARRQRNKNTQ